MTGGGTAGAAVNAEAATVCGAEDAERKTRKAAAHTNTPIIRPAVNQKTLAGRRVDSGAGWSRGARTPDFISFSRGMIGGGTTAKAFFRSERTKRGNKRAFGQMKRNGDPRQI